MAEVGGAAESPPRFASITGKKRTLIYNSLYGCHG
jgi:hypothetical protein